jgi:hypothetical protein
MKKCLVEKGFFVLPVLGSLSFLTFLTFDFGRKSDYFLDLESGNIFEEVEKRFEVIRYSLKREVYYLGDKSFWSDLPRENLDVHQQFLDCWCEDSLEEPLLGFFSYDESHKHEDLRNSGRFYFRVR